MAMRTSFYDRDELAEIGFRQVGNDVLVSRKASFYTPSSISIGNHVRIDDFCLLSGEISLGNHIHVSAFAALYGANGIVMRDFSGLSPRTIVLSATDDFSGEHLVGPMVDERYRRVTGGTVLLERYVQIGAGSVLLPGVSVGEGTAVGALSLVNRSLEPWGIYAGVPARFLRERKRGLLELAGRIPD